MWFALGSVAFREAYEDAKSWNTSFRKNNSVEGRYRWLTTAILVTEAVLCWKYRENTGHIIEGAAENTPRYIWVPWVGTFVLITIYWAYLRFKPGHTVKYPREDDNEEESTEAKVK